MNKAKAIFSGAMILAVAGTSAVCWYLNDQGIIGKDKESVSDSYIEYADNNNGYDDNGYENSPEGDNGNDAADETTTVAEAKPESDIANEEIADFLTVFTKVYFSEKEKFETDSYDTYELIRFAYSHIKRTSPDSIEVVQTDDQIGYYNKVSADEVNAVLDEYLGIRVAAESAYTENDYAFFRYSDGFFMTPAADGLPFKNTAVIENLDISDNTVNASFTIYSGDEMYARGEAVIRYEDGGLTLVSYDISK